MISPSHLMKHTKHRENKACVEKTTNYIWIELMLTFPLRNECKTKHPLSFPSTHSCAAEPLDSCTALRTELLTSSSHAKEHTCPCSDTRGLHVNAHPLGHVCGWDRVDSTGLRWT